MFNLGSERLDGLVRMLRLDGAHDVRPGINAKVGVVFLDDCFELHLLFSHHSDPSFPARPLLSRTLALLAEVYLYSAYLFDIGRFVLDFSH